MITANKKYTKQQAATAIAILFHTVGLLGILVFKNDLVARLTPFNLLLSFFLIVWTQENKNQFFWLFVVSAITIGFAVEVVGVNTGALFGNYKYGNVLGVKYKQVPLVIGVNWFLVIYCSGIAITVLLEKIIRPVSKTPAEPAPVLKAISVISDGATLALAFDWLIEPVAVKLGYWKWQMNEIPLYNYICWFVISLILLSLFRLLKFEKRNKFAVNLLLVQVMFFLILRTFLPDE